MIPRMPQHLRSCVRWAAKDPKDQEFIDTDDDKVGRPACRAAYAKLMDQEAEDHRKGYPNVKILCFDFGWCCVYSLPAVNDHSEMRLWMMKGWPTKDDVVHIFEEFDYWFYHNRVTKVLDRIGACQVNTLLGKRFVLEDN